MTDRGIELKMNKNEAHAEFIKWIEAHDPAYWIVNGRLHANSKCYKAVASNILTKDTEQCCFEYEED